MVGGAVRDALLGRPVEDIDIASSADAETAMQVLADAGAHVIPTGIAHGTITAVLDGEAFEVTAFRVDGSYSDSRHPDSISSAHSIEEDLARRDFTINAMAYNEQRGLVDPFGGHADLDHHIIRCVGDPKVRFGEDALRIMRAIRFSAQLGFSIEEETASAIHEFGSSLIGISRERIGTELAKTICAPGGAIALQPFTDIICTVLPDASPEMIGENLRVLAQLDSEELPLRLAALLGSDGNLGRFLSSLRLPKRTADTCLAIAEAASRELPHTTYQGKIMLGRYGASVACAALELAGARLMADGIEADSAIEARHIIDDLVDSGACCTVGALAVDGSDIRREWGLDGVDIGRALHALLDLVMRDEVPNERDALLGARSSLPGC